MTRSGRTFESGVAHPDIENLPAEAHRAPIRQLGAYQRVAHTPGVLLAASLLVSVVAAVGGRRRRPAHQRWACLLLATSGLLVLVVPAATVTFDYRYLLPATALLVPAGAIAVESLRRRPQDAG